MTLTSPARLFTTMLLLALAGCATTAVGPAREGSYELVPGQQAEVAANARLVYESSNDSRCPADVRCMWAGTITYQFHLVSKEKTEPFTLSPSRPEFVSGVLHGAHIELDPASIPPAPATAAEVSKQHPVSIKITKPAS